MDCPGMPQHIPSAVLHSMGVKAQRRIPLLSEIHESASERHKDLFTDYQSSRPAESTPSLPNGNVGADYSQQLQATGGGGNLTWTIISGSLPDGLDMNQTTGVILGTPTVAGLSPFTVQVTDGLGQSDSQPLSITIDLAL